MADLLFLAHRIPYPPNKGDKIRSWNVLAHLAERHRVHLGCFVDETDDWDHVAPLLDVCQECNIVPLDPSPLRLDNVPALWTGAPITIRHYRRRSMHRWVADVIRRRPIDTAFVFSSAMAQFLSAPGAEHMRAVIDFVDVDSDKWRQYAERKSGPMRWVYRRESRTLLAFERAMAARSAASVFVSDNEAALFKRLAPETAGKVTAIPNGVDTERFRPDPALDRPFPADRPALVFTGAMDYWANVDAVTWFAEQVLPAVRLAVPGAAFWIVGANPDPAVRKLAEREGVHVTGRVADTRPYLAHADLVVAPLRIARGIQNKVLEAMAMAKAVVTTGAASAGAEACVAGADLLVADEPEPFAGLVVDLLGDPVRRDRIGCRGRARVVESYGWGASFARLDQVLGLPVPAGRLGAEAA